MKIFTDTLCDEPSERHVCNDGLTVIEKTQICDDVPDCPINNNGYYLVAEDESTLCPGNCLPFRPFVIKNIMILKYVNTELHFCGICKPKCSQFQAGFWEFGKTQ